MRALSILTLIITGLFYTSAQAQISVGLQTGYTYAWAEYGNINLPEDAQIDVNGYNISLLMGYRLGKYLQVGLEPGYVRRGAACYPGSFNWGQGNNFFRQDTKFFLGYLETPLMISGHLPMFKGKLELICKAGYGASMLVSALREDTELDTGLPPTLSRVNLKENTNLNRWDHGIYSGIGFAIKTGRNQLLLSSDFYMGFIDAERSSRSQNRSVDVSMGYVVWL